MDRTGANSKEQIIQMIQNCHFFQDIQCILKIHWGKYAVALSWLIVVPPALLFVYTGGRQSLAHH